MSLFLRYLAMVMLSLLATSGTTPASHAADGVAVLPELRFVEIPTTARDKFAGDRFSYMEAGARDAPAILMLHGIGANSSYWRYQFAGLSDRYRLIAWNAPGYFMSDNLRKARPACDDYADAVAAFTEALGLTRFHLVGNSFGSAVAQCFAERNPDRVKRMILSGTSVGATGTPPDVREQTFQRRQKQFERAGGMGYARDVIGLVVSAKASEQARAVVMDVLAGTNGPGYLQASFVAYELDALSLAPRIKIPVLMIHGTEDKIAPIERTSVALEKALPNGKLVRLDGYGHLPEVEAFERVNILWREFFEQK
jgi:pimeloyl-ACP methyl ester carboxylesterase